MKAFVYWNLHKNVWSVKAMSGEFKGKVVAHSNKVTLLNATPKVSEAGRLRVIKEQRKNVHAGIVGEVIALGVDFDMKYGINVRDILYQHTHGIDNNGLFPTHSTQGSCIIILILLKGSFTQEQLSLF